MNKLKPQDKENLPGTAGLFARPRPVKSGQPFKQRVVVSHRSDNLLKEQVSVTRHFTVRVDLVICN